MHLIINVGLPCKYNAVVISYIVPADTYLGSWPRDRKKQNATVDTKRRLYMYTVQYVNLEQYIIVISSNALADKYNRQGILACRVQ